MLIGGLVILIMIRAGLLKLILWLLAKNEADTSYSKQLMVAGGLTVGEVAVQMFLSQYHPLFMLVALLVLNVSVIMGFCWITWWKSLLVVLIYGLIQIVFLVILALLFGLAILGAITGGKSGSGSDQAFREQMQKAAQEAKAPPAPKQSPRAQISRPPTPAKADTTKKEQPKKPEAKKPEAKKPEVKKEEPKKKVDEKKEISEDTWVEARSRLKIGGILKGRDNKTIVMINQVPKDEGATVQVEYGKAIYRWRIKSITTAGPDLERLDANPVE